MTLLRWALPVILTLAAASAMAADEDAPNRKPVKAVADSRIAVGTKGTLPLYVSSDWSKPEPDIVRAVIVLHGRLRNADVYYRSAKTAQAAAGAAGQATIMIVPQFLSQIDVEAYHLPADTLRWTLEGWEGGDDATGPQPASSFEALDAILARLADRKLFPNLRDVVVAGHSGGGQVVQRYAIAGRGEAPLTEAHIAVRYVVANPSSYAYFSDQRPELEIAASCTGYDNWKYGMQARPDYLGQADAGRAGKSLCRAARDLPPRHGGHQPEPSGAGQELHGRGAGTLSLRARPFLCRHDGQTRPRHPEPSPVRCRRRRP